jgi:Gpi18-like mannosyltransferase
LKRALALPLGGAFLFWAAASALLARLPGFGLAGAVIAGLVLCLALGGCLRALGLKGRALYVCAVLAALLVLSRTFFFPTATSDFTDFLLPWTERLRKLGGLRGLGTEIGNYNVPYMVLLALFSYLKIPVLYLIKYTETLFDLLLALSLGLLVRQLGGSRLRSCVCFLLALALPTVFLNSAVWGQCDSLYVSLALLGLWLCLAGKPGWGMAAFALSFAFKLQAVFLLPILFPLLVSGRVKWRHIPIFPATYLLAVSPAILAGRKITDVLLFYVSSASSVGSGLNYNSPSMYSLLYFYRLSDTAAAAKAGILAAALLCLLVCVLFFIKRKQISDKSILFGALLLCCGLPLLLPHMHDRYFFFCDVLTLCVSCLLPAAAPTVLLSQFASLLGYHAYFYMRYLLPMRFGFFGLVLTALLAACLFLDALFSPKPAPPDS